LQSVPRMRRSLLLVALLACGACSGRAPSLVLERPLEADDAAVPPYVAPPTDAGLFTANDGGVGADGCTDAARLVYVVSEGGELFSFDPGGLVFAKIGALGCPVGVEEYPNSMAVDRAGTAWVNYSDGNLYEVSTADASCKTTSFVADQFNIHLFGMGFATNGVGTTSETLYVCDLAGSGLAALDLGTMKLDFLGGNGAQLSGYGCELTGTGDGRLFGFFTTMPASLAQLGTGPTGASGQVSLTGVTTGDAWAFSFWGGDFYLYSAIPYDANHPYSDVWRYRPSDGSVSEVMSNVGMRIFGAGVSTCAPTTPVIK
jgi:hypothetical protein